MKLNVLIRYGELVIKGNNRKEFTNKLAKNVNSLLKNIVNRDQVKFKRDHALILNLDETKKSIIFSILTKVPGIESFSIINIVENDHSLIKESIKDQIKDLQWKTFKVNCRRKNKDFLPKSDIFKLEVAEFVFKSFPDKKVDVRNPDLNINIKINNNNTYIFNNKIMGVGGLPSNTSGRVLMLISGGIDSPVASYLMMKRGLHVDFLTFSTPPHTSPEVIEKTKSLIKIVNQFQGKSRFLNCNFTPILHELAHISKPAYKINLMRREFIRIANEIALRDNYLAIVTGDALGQVASQTLESLNTINVVSKVLIMRPLIGYNKIEIINLARKINTYETSILPFEDSCSLFAPKSPVTRPNIARAELLETEIPLLEELRKNVINNNITEEVVDIAKYE